MITYSMMNVVVCVVDIDNVVPLDIILSYIVILTTNDKHGECKYGYFINKSNAWR